MEKKEQFSLFNSHVVAIYSPRIQNSNFFSTQFISMAQFFCKDTSSYQVTVFWTKN